MAQDTSVNLAAATWTRLTNATVTALRVQNQTSDILHLKGVNGTTAPTTLLGTITLFPGAAIAADLTLAQLWPGISATDVFAYSPTGGAVSFSHA